MATRQLANRHIDPKPSQIERHRINQLRVTGLGSWISTRWKNYSEIRNGKAGPNIRINQNNVSSPNGIDGVAISVLLSR
jgi:hypothetical protein